jgi:hypothetical protein
LTFANAVAVDPQWIYLLAATSRNDVSTLFRVPRCGGEPRVLYAPLSAPLRSMLLDNQYVFVGVAGGAIIRIPK